jgi:hypothetical protein
LAFALSTLDSNTHMHAYIHEDSYVDRQTGWQTETSYQMQVCHTGMPLHIRKTNIDGHERV